MNRPVDLDIIHAIRLHVFMANKLQKLKYTGLLLRHVSAIESSHPQGVHFTK